MASLAQQTNDSRPPATFSSTFRSAEFGTCSSSRLNQALRSVRSQASRIPVRDERRAYGASAVIRQSSERLTRGPPSASRRSCAVCNKLDHDVLPLVRTRDLAGIPLVRANTHNPPALALHNDEDAARQGVVPLRCKILHKCSRPLERKAAFA